MIVQTSKAPARRAPSCGHCPTRRHCLGAGLEGECLRALEDTVEPSAPLRRGETLYQAGEAADCCFVVRSGVFKTCVQSRDGQHHVSGFHYPGEVIGLSACASGRFLESAVALETSTACRLPVADTSRLLALPGGGGVVSSLLRLVGRAERQHLDEHTNLSRNRADQRIAGFLVNLAGRLNVLGRDSRWLPLPMSRTDLANHLGMTLECLSRVLGRLHRCGTIRAERDGIALLDPERLRSLAGHLES